MASFLKKAMGSNSDAMINQAVDQAGENMGGAWKG